MHPIEQLRFVARSRGVDSGLLVEEAADALGFFANEQRALITACRQLLSRQPGVGPLWWLCNRLVLAKDPRTEARLVLEEHWAFASGVGHQAIEEDLHNPLVIWTDAAGLDAGPGGTGQALLSPEVAGQVDEAESTDRPIWMVMAPGVWLPTIIWEEVKVRCSLDQANGLELADLKRVSRIIGPDGPLLPDQLAQSTIAVAPELLVRLN